MRKVFTMTIVSMALLILLGFTLGPVYAALGDIIPGSSFTPTPTGNGRGIAFDGTDLYYTLYGILGAGVIYKVSTTGTAIATITQTGAAAGVQIAALAWDASRGKLWGGSYDATGDIYLIDPTTGASTLEFNVLGLLAGDPPTYFAPYIGWIDGLAYDPVTDTLWFSDDGGYVVHHIDTTGLELGKFSIVFANSGIAHDGTYLWLAKVTSPYQVRQYTTAGSEVSVFTHNLIVEGLEYDPITFSPKCALWSIQNGIAAGTLQINAFEIPCPRIPDGVPEFGLAIPLITSIATALYLGISKKFRK